MAELEMIIFPLPATAPLAHTPQALPPTKMGATLGPLMPALSHPALLRGARLAGGHHLGGAAVVSSDPEASYLLARVPRAGRLPAQPPAGATAAARALPAWGPRLRPAPPRAGDLGVPASGPALGAPDSGRWSGGASPWRPRASPGSGSFWGFQF